LLDVGCASGLLLEHARNVGWEVAGVEPAGAASEQAIARGLDVHQGFYQDIDLPAGSFDVVHSKLVFEHLPDPMHFIAWAQRLLSRGGIFSVQAPNEFTSLQIAARDAIGAEQWWVAPPAHLNYWDFESIERVLVRSGLQLVARDATFPVEWFLLMGDDYVHNPEVGPQIHARRIRLETELEAIGLRRPFHALLADHGLGREAIVHARRMD
jgi:SAM-dependent methyltransferase